MYRKYKKRSPVTNLTPISNLQSVDISNHTFQNIRQRARVQTHYYLTPYLRSFLKWKLCTSLCTSRTNAIAQIMSFCILNWIQGQGSENTCLTLKSSDGLE